MNLLFPKTLLLAAVCVFSLVSVPTLPAQEGSPTPSASPRPPRPAPRREDPTENKDIALSTLLADYGKLIGKKIVPDNTVNPTTSVTAPDLAGSNDQQKAALIEETLFLNGYTLIDLSDDIVAILGPGKNPRSTGTPLYTKPEDFPRNERVFSYLCVLKHRDAIEICGLLQQFIPPGNDVNFTADEKGHAIIATVPTSTMRTVLKVLATSDATVETAH